MSEILKAIPTISNAPGARARGDKAAGPEDASGFLQAFRPGEGEDADPDSGEAQISLVDFAASAGAEAQATPEVLVLVDSDPLPPTLPVADPSRGAAGSRGQRLTADDAEGIAQPQDGRVVRGSLAGFPDTGADPGAAGKTASTIAARTVLAALGTAARPVGVPGATDSEDVTPDLLAGRGVSLPHGRPEGQGSPALPFPPSLAQQRVAGAMLEGGRAAETGASRRSRPELTQTTPNGSVVIPPALLRAAAVQPIAQGLGVVAGEGQKIQTPNLSGLAMAAIDGVPGPGVPLSMLPPGAPPPGLFADQAAMSQRVAAQIVQILSTGGNPSGAPVELALDPPELGRVRLNLTEINGVYALTIAVERPETADLMRRHIALLADEFARAGLDAPSVNISQDGAGGRSASREGAATRADAPVEGLVVVQPGAATPQPFLGTSQGLDLRL